MAFSLMPPLRGFGRLGGDQVTNLTLLCSLSFGRIRLIPYPLQLGLQNCGMAGGVARFEPRMRRHFSNRTKQTESNSVRSDIRRLSSMSTFEP